MKKHGKYSSNKGLNMKPLAILLALTLLVGCAVGGTLAWLTAQTPDVVNTFTVGNIEIYLKEHELITNTTTGEYALGTEEVIKNDKYLFVPGDTLPKDPFVKVMNNSEKCYLFIKVKIENNTATDEDVTENPVTVSKILNWTVRDQDSNPANTDATMGWVAYTAGDTTDAKCYYRIVEKQTGDADGYQKFEILKDNQVTVSTDVVKDVVDEINDNLPKLTFSAAAVQFDNIESLADAWKALPTAFKS